MSYIWLKIRKVHLNIFFTLTCMYRGNLASENVHSLARKIKIYLKKKKSKCKENSNIKFTHYEIPYDTYCILIIIVIYYYS